MSTFVIRNQGFFYTDEYFAPVGEYKQIVKRTFATREAAEEARKVYVRSWIRRHPMGDFFFDDRAAVEKVVALFRERWPAEHEDLHGDDLYEVLIPKEATDEEVDAILHVSGLELANVFELEPGELAAEPPQEDADDEDLEEDDPDDDVYWGPIEGQKRRFL